MSSHLLTYSAIEDALYLPVLVWIGLFHQPVEPKAEYPEQV